MYTDNTSKTEITLAAAFGDQGINGVDGVAGEDGKTYYTWLKYADTIDGDGLSDSPDGKEYIGFPYICCQPGKSGKAYQPCIRKRAEGYGCCRPCI